MKTRKNINIIATIVILLGLSSCIPTKRAYVGPRQKKSSLAIVNGINSTKVKETTRLLRADSIPLFDETHLSSQYNRCEVLPENHTFEMALFQKNGVVEILIGDYLVNFDAEAGKTYAIGAKLEPETSTVDVYVTEEKSGKRVPSTVEYKYKLK